MARKQTVKLVKKKWYDIVTSGHFDNVKVGETLLDDSNKLVGKPVAVNVMNLTGNYKQQSITLDYTVTKVEGDRGIAEFRAFRLSPSFIKRIVRRRSTRIDHSFVAKTKDGELLRLKPMIIARNHISTDLKNEIRKAATISLIKKVSSMSADEVLGSLLGLGIQRDLKRELGEFCPIKLVEIRVAEKVESGVPLTVESVQTRGFSTKKIRKSAKRGSSKKKDEESEEELDANEEFEVEEDDSEETGEEFDDSAVNDEDLEEETDEDAEATEPEGTDEESDDTEASEDDETKA